LTDRWINECRIVDAKYGVVADGLKLSALEMRMLPALSRGQVVSNSDGGGRVFYAAASRTWTRPAPASAKYIDDGGDCYIAARDAACQRLRDERSDFARRIVVMPLPASNGGMALRGWEPDEQSEPDRQPAIAAVGRDDGDEEAAR